MVRNRTQSRLTLRCTWNLKKWGKLKVLLIDNYDSFVYNLAQYVGELGTEPLIYRNDELSAEKARKLGPDRIIISPGPGNPEDPRYFGCSSDIIRDLGDRIPVLGVCLGHQGITTTFGGRLKRASVPMHGKTSRIRHTGDPLFNGFENPFEATRYHSLICDETTFPKCLRITARSEDDGAIMGLRHEKFPIFGVQFHPESILTRNGIELLRNFLNGDL